jgi:DNA-binding IclR family transcriptional regulator
MPTARVAIDRKDLIEGLGKGLRVIESFDDDHVRITPAEAAARADISRTAARRYLLSLVHFGYAASDGKRFWLLPRVLRLGQGFSRIGAPAAAGAAVHPTGIDAKRRDCQRERARRP